jgi:hypothetical protein
MAPNERVCLPYSFEIRSRTPLPPDEIWTMVRNVWLSYSPLLGGLVCTIDAPQLATQRGAGDGVAAAAELAPSAASTASRIDSIRMV